MWHVASAAFGAQIPSQTISAANASVHAPPTHHGSIVAASGVPFQAADVTVQRVPSVLIPFAHAYTHPHAFATIGKQRASMCAAIAVASAGLTPGEGAALVGGTRTTTGGGAASLPPHATSSTAARQRASNGRKAISEYSPERRRCI